ncbi:MAG: hypothetical protein QM758_08640 [Armatimonas sp.]
MPKLKKHTSESRSEKRERLAEQEYNDQIARAQQDQLYNQERQLVREWHSILKNRLDSDEAYARFETFLRQKDNRPDNWRTDNPEPLIAIYRHKDGKSIDPEIILHALEQEPRLSMVHLRIAKQLAFKGLWSESQLQRLRVMVLRHLSYREALVLKSRFHGWHRCFLGLARLARAITDDSFEAQVHLLVSNSGATGEMAARLIVHLEQERNMRVVRPIKG